MLCVGVGGEEARVARARRIGARLESLTGQSAAEAVAAWPARRRYGERRQLNDVAALGDRVGGRRGPALMNGFVAAGRRRAERRQVRRVEAAAARQRVGQLARC